MVPYNPGLNHWFLVVLDKIGNALIVDSIVKPLGNYDDAVALSRQALIQILHVDVSTNAGAQVWKHWWQQRDGYNCGLFTCISFLLFIRKPDLLQRLMDGDDISLPNLPQPMLAQMRQDMFVFMRLVYPTLDSRNGCWVSDPSVLELA